MTYQLHNFQVVSHEIKNMVQIQTFKNTSFYYEQFKILAIIKYDTKVRKYSCVVVRSFFFFTRFHCLPVDREIFKR